MPLRRSLDASHQEGMFIFMRSIFNCEKGYIMKKKSVKIALLISAWIFASVFSNAETLYFTNVAFNDTAPIYIWNPNNTVTWKTESGTNQLPAMSGDSLVISPDYYEQTSKLYPISFGGVTYPTPPTPFEYSFDSIYITNYISSSDSYYSGRFDMIMSPYSNSNIVANASVGEITVASGSTQIMSRGYVSNTYSHDLNLSVVGDVVVGSAKPEGSSLANDLTGNLNFGGNGRYYEGQADAIPLQSLSIGGNVIIGGASGVHLNVGYKPYGSTYDINSPDVAINGVVVGYNGSYIDSTTGETKTNLLIGSHQFSAFTLSNGNNTNAANSVGATQVIQVGGLSGVVTTQNHARKSPGQTLSVLVFTNTADYTLRSTFSDDQGSSTASDYCANSKIKVVMKGSDDGRQVIGDGNYFSGGLDVISGTIAFDSAKAGSNGYGVRDDTADTLFTHGELFMQGGVLELYASTSNFTNFSFNKASYEGGTILLYVVDDKVTNISLDKLGADDATGGYFTSASGGSAVVEFDFSGEVANLVDMGESKIVSWTGYDENLSFHAENEFIYGQEYEYKFRAVQGDGLYVQLSAVVPEPGLTALILGLFAGIFAIRCKRS